MVNPESSLDKVTTIASHPQALAQCRRWLDAHFPSCLLYTSLLHEEVVLDPRDKLMLVVILGHPGLVVANTVTRATRRSRGNQECKHVTNDAVEEQHQTAEHMHAASNARKSCPEREVDQEAEVNGTFGSLP